MAFITSTISLSLPSSISPVLRSEPRHPLSALNFPLSIGSPVALPAIFQSNRSRHRINSRNENPRKTSQIWRISASLEDFSLSEANPVENSSEIVSTGDEGAATVISVLLFAAFVGLSILTIGVIYIGVTDFLQRREREKFEKEETAAKKKNGKKGTLRTRARAGPRGFGQKVEEVDDDFED